ncbi:MAG: hypothetical protein Q8S84_02025 [bacterium]|nr:hypothetical protein [bacterium]MDP3380333.1 hypothetical protein [bacterium]
MNHLPNGIICNISYSYTQNFIKNLTISGKNLTFTLFTTISIFTITSGKYFFIFNNHLIDLLKAHGVATR